MQVSFYLDKSNADKAGLISVFYSITVTNSRIRKKVKGVKVKEKHWNPKAQRIRQQLKSEDYNNHIEYNKILDETESNIKNLFRYILLNNINPTKEFILEKINNGFDNVKLSHDFFPSFNEFIEVNKSTKVPRTIKSYVTTFNFLKDFEETIGYKLSFESIDNLFFEKLQDYTFVERQNKNSYLAFIVKVLKTFLNWTIEREYHNNLKYKKFKAKEDEIEVIYLTMDELMSLFNYEFKSERLSHVRDVYCFGCFTGLRFSDIKALRLSNVFKDYIKINIQKTKTKDHKVPLNQFASQILNRYKNTIYEPLPVISGQKFNKYIKETCEIVGIDTPTTITRYIGQKRIDKTVPKYELITSHTARKTFVTNSLILGMKEMVVRNITGHKKEDSFRKYVKIAEDFKSQEMENTWNRINK
ncbi:MAG: tyrosine-type recombinase/integrase [Flavobacteriaceae bacterium]